MTVDHKPSRGPNDVFAGASCQFLYRGHAMLNELTPAERLVATHVAQGLSNKEIAAALGRAQSTIKRQLGGVLHKFDLQSRCQLIVRLLT